MAFHEGWCVRVLKSLKNFVENLLQTKQIINFFSNQNQCHLKLKIQFTQQYKSNANAKQVREGKGREHKYKL